MTTIKTAGFTGDTLEIIAFRLHDQEFCVNIMSVREIRGWTKATPMPHAPRYVLGVINLRGVVLPIIDLSARLGGEVGRVETARQILRQASGLYLPEPAHHVGLWGDIAGRAGLRELACNQPPAAGGEGAVDLGRESPRRRVRAPLGEDRLVEPGRAVIGGLSLQLDGREDLYPGMNRRLDLEAVAAERHERTSGR